MKKVYQTRFGGADSPECEQGNCMQACFASLFEIELNEAPDFTGGIVNGKWFLILERWLEKRNLELSFINVKGTIPPMKGYYIQTAKSTTLANPDDGHVVIFQNGKLVHNPHPEATSVGELEEAYMLTPIDITLMNEYKKSWLALVTQKLYNIKNMW